jgi:hypothetical protein
VHDIEKALFFYTTVKLFNAIYRQLAFDSLTVEIAFKQFKTVVQKNRDDSSYYSFKKI